ncbi:MAG: hypothetical protein CVU14_07625 [Bacteroidetes bacterium HGW-Bacteroidetes-9]|jgi:hypothetical protein|nr:MAG: hypothetical protein CVU14_07625 [Bacteroidetes bacterium HGW-Bacteroidetes-9]
MKSKNLYNTIRHLLVLIAVSVSAFSCTKRIDIDLDEGFTRLVVDAIITTDTMAHTVKLTTTSSYFYAEAAPTVSGAIVTLNDGETETTLTETGPGVYQTAPDFYGIPGRTYKLNINLASPIGGFSNYSAESLMNPGLTLDSINSVFHEDWGSDGFYELKCYALDPPTTDFYMFKVYKNGTLLSDSLNKVFITDDRFYNGNYTNGIGVGYLNQSKTNEKVIPGDQLTIESARITEAYYQFVTQLQIQSGFQTPLFSGPPANISGNISNGAIGFFAAYPVTYSNTIAQP